MRCPKCHFPDSKVIDSRTSGDTIRRRRECLSEPCGERFTTHERMESRIPWIVKKDGRRLHFAREKVLRGIELACRKRPVDAAAMEQAVRRVEELLESIREQEVLSSVVGEAVMDVLRDIDEVAYVRFASVYRNFESVDQFVDAIRPLREGQV
jgi:transcriptional repressor NrdR